MIHTYDFLVNSPEYFKKLTVKDMLFVTYKCPQLEDHLKLYSHYNQITFTLKGKKLFNRRGKSWLLSEDKTVFIWKTAWSQEMVYDTEWELLNFFFGDDILQQVFTEYRELFPLHHLPTPCSDILMEIHVNEMTRAFFYGIVPYFTQQRPPAEKLLELKFKELILNILSNPANSSLLAYVKSICEGCKPMLNEIMEANYTFNLTLEEFARISQLSLSSFKRKFFKTYHTTPGRWLIQKRLQHARYMLEESLKNINEIADDSGFDNVTHFSRVFKEKYGLSPLQYRKKLKMESQV